MPRQQRDTESLRLPITEWKESADSPPVYLSMATDIMKTLFLDFVRAIASQMPNVGKRQQL
jgi:hypothetical protein